MPFSRFLSGNPVYLECERKKHGNLASTRLQRDSQPRFRVTHG